MTRLGRMQEPRMDVNAMCNGMLEARNACKRGQADLACPAIERAFSDL